MLKPKAMTKEEILDRNHNLNLGMLSITESQIHAAMDEYAAQEVAKERERLELLIKNEPISFFLVNIIKSLPNEKWPALINALNERCSLPTKEREKAEKLVDALHGCLSIIEIASSGVGKETNYTLCNGYKTAIQSLSSYTKPE